MSCEKEAINGLSIVISTIIHLLIKWEDIKTNVLEPKTEMRLIISTMLKEHFHRSLKKTEKQSTLDG